MTTALPARIFLTGGTGLVGSHVAERLRSPEFQIVALVRDGSDARHLEALGVQIVRGGLDDASALARAMQGCRYMVHAAATVGEGIARRQLMQTNAAGTTRVLMAARSAGIEQAVVLSSLAVLGARAQYGADESAPYGHTGDPYLESKIAGEQAARRFAEDRGYPIVILRPTQIYGPRDRAFLPVVIQNLLDRKMIHVDRGMRIMSITHAANVAEAIALALGNPRASGNIYHITDGAPITRRAFVDAICRELAIEPPRVSISYPVLALACNAFELASHILPSKRPPLLNRYRFKFLACHLDYSIAKAQRELGYAPVIDSARGLSESVRWMKRERPDICGRAQRSPSPIAKLIGDPELFAHNQRLLAALAGGDSR